MRFLTCVILLAMAIGGAWFWRLERDEVAQLRRRTVELERREMQLREFVVRHARPLRLQHVTSAEEARLLIEWRLNQDTLEWEHRPPFFGVDRSKLRQPGRTGDVAGDVEP